MSHYVTIRFDFSDTSKYASIPLYIGFPATFIPFFIYIQSELSPLHALAVTVGVHVAVSACLEAVLEALGEPVIGVG